MDNEFTGRMNTRRTFMCQLAVTAGSLPMLTAGAESAAAVRVPRIGFLVSSTLPVLTNAFIEELRAQGYTDGENIIVERTETAKGAVATRPDFIVAGSLPWALSVRAEDPNMPMVIATCPGMISNGFAHTLEHPGGIYTGLDELPPGVTARRLTLLKLAAPTVKRIALLSTTPGVGGHETQLADAEQAAQSLGLSVQPYRATNADEVDVALEAIDRDRMDGLLNFQGAVSLFRRQVIADFAAAHRLPAIYQATLFAEAGGLMTWAPDLVEQYREAARLAAKLLRGAKPGEIPVKYPSKYFLTVNAGAARKIGLTLPPALLEQADRVIE